MPFDRSSDAGLLALTTVGRSSAAGKALPPRTRNLVRLDTGLLPPAAYALGFMQLADVFAEYGRNILPGQDEADNFLPERFSGGLRHPIRHSCRLESASLRAWSRLRERRQSCDHVRTSSPRCRRGGLAIQRRHQATTSIGIGICDPAHVVVFEFNRRLQCVRFSSFSPRPFAIAKVERWPS